MYPAAGEAQAPRGTIVNRFHGKIWGRAGVFVILLMISMSTLAHAARYYSPALGRFLQRDTVETEHERESTDPCEKPGRDAGGCKTIPRRCGGSRHHFPPWDGLKIEPSCGTNQSPVPVRPDVGARRSRDSSGKKHEPGGNSKGVSSATRRPRTNLRTSRSLPPVHTNSTLREEQRVPPIPSFGL